MLGQVSESSCPELVVIHGDGVARRVERRIIRIGPFLDRDDSSQISQLSPTASLRSKHTMSVNPASSRFITAMIPDGPAPIIAKCV